MSATLLFDELLERLRREGFSAGTDQYLRMHALFDRYPAASPDELKTLLGPIFATSAAEQQRFHVAYDDFFAVRTVPKQTIARRMTLIGQPLPRTARPQKRFRWRYLAIAMSIVAVAVTILWLSADRPSPSPRVAPTPSAAAPRGRAVPPPPQSPQVLPPVAPRPLWLLIAGTFAVALFVAEVVRTLLRWLRQREHRAQGRPFDWPVRDPHPTAPRLFADQRFFGIARLMKGRETGEMRRLDVPRSILSTIRSLGDPVFEYRLDRRVTEYLFLIERRAERDHLSAYVHAMADALAREGVLVEVFEHDGDPRNCWKPGSTLRFATAELYSRFPRHRLVIAGNAVALTNPVTGEALDSIPRLFPWTYRAILTPEDESRGVSLFGAYFDVYALANKGLARLAERWQQTDGPAARRRPEKRQRLAADLSSSPEELERDLDPLIFRWLLRCAVHPTLHWDLSRALAPSLPAAEHEAALLDLARLEWFRQGRIPEPERLALVSRLSDDVSEETAARASAMRVLAAAPPPPPGSMAARVFEIQQLAHRIWGARDRPAELRPLLRTLRHYPLSQVARDGALTMLLHQAPGTLITHHLPQPLRRFLFRDGIPAFGMKNFVALAAVLPVMLFAGTVSRQDPAPIERPPVRKQERPTPPAPTALPTATTMTALEIPAAPTATTVTASEIPAAATATTLTASEIPAAAVPHVIVPSPPAVDGYPPHVPPHVEEPPAAGQLAELPKLLAPAAGSVVTIDDSKDVVAFEWAPAGNYTLQVFNSQGTPVHVEKVRGTSTTWRVTSASSGNSWSLLTADGRATEPMTFGIEYEILFTPASIPRTYRTVEITLPVSCSETEGKRAVDLHLLDHETFESAKIEVLNRSDFEVAELTPQDRGSFAYRLLGAKGCVENRLQATIRVTATIRLTLPAPPSK